MSAITFDQADSQVYHYAMYCYGAAATLCFVIAFLTILYNSPQSFGYYKYFLLNIAICAFIYDFYMCIIYQPKVLMPVLAMCPNGLGRTESDAVARVIMFVFFILMGCNIVSVLSAFIYRFAILHNYLSIVISKKFIAFLTVLHLGYCSPIIFGYGMALRDSQYGRSIVYEEYPSIKPYIANVGCSIAQFSEPMIKFFSLPVGTILYTSGFPVIAFLVFKSFVTLKNSRYHMSPKTYEMHRQLLYSLIFQLVIPSTSIFIPCAIMVVLIFFGIHNIALITQILYLLNASHSFFNTFMMLYFIKPYRRRLLSFIGKGSVSGSTYNPHLYKRSISVVHPNSYRRKSDMY